MRHHDDDKENNNGIYHPDDEEDINSNHYNSTGMFGILDKTFIHSFIYSFIHRFIYSFFLSFIRDHQSVLIRLIKMNKLNPFSYRRTLAVKLSNDKCYDISS